MSAGVSSTRKGICKCVAHSYIHHVYTQVDKSNEVPKYTIKYHREIHNKNQLPLEVNVFRFLDIEINPIYHMLVRQSGTKIYINKEDFQNL